MEYFPLTKDEALKRGYAWRDPTDEKPDVKKVIPAKQLPQTIGEIPDDVLNWAVVCLVTGRPFRIIKQELAFYRQLDLPLPHKHPDERHRERTTSRSGIKLFSRTCSKCGKEMKTTYGPDRPETVFCENCYLQEVY